MRENRPSTRPQRWAALLAAALAVLAAAATAGCGGDPTGPPEIVLDRSVCAGCGMLVSEARFAAGYRAGARTAVFDDIGCLLDALDRAGLATEAGISEAMLPGGGAGEGGAAGETGAAAEESLARVWVWDDAERWTPAEEAFFVRAPGLATPMGGGIQATASRAAAERLAASTGGSIVGSMAELRAQWRGGAVESTRGTP